MWETLEAGKDFARIYDTGKRYISGVPVQQIKSSNAAFEIDGFEKMWLVTKQFPCPELSSAGEIEVPMPLEVAKWEPHSRSKSTNKARSP